MVTLTPAQARVVAHGSGPLRVRGVAGSGKTTALHHRYLRLAGEHGAGRVLVVCADRAAATRFRDKVLPALHGAFDRLPITTFWGLAFDLVHRHDGPVRLLTGAEQRALVTRMLAAEAGDRSRWPTLHELVGRPAFAHEVASALLDLRAALVSPDQVRAVASAAGVGERWEELLSFAARYDAELASRSALDGAGVLARAGQLLAQPQLATTERGLHSAVLVDDMEAATVADVRLLVLLVGKDGPVTTAGDPHGAGTNGAGTNGALACFADAFAAAVDVKLGVSFRRPAPTELVRCHHPSLEPEAVAGELLAARERGGAWASMAVLARSPARRRAVTRALARHAIPVASAPGAAADDPVVRGLLDLLRWVNGEAGALDRLLTSPLADLGATELRDLRRAARHAATPLEAHPRLASLVAARDDLRARAPVDDVATLAHEAFRRCLAHLVPSPGDAHDPLDERALDAVVAFLDGLARHVEHNPRTLLSEYLELVDDPAAAPVDPWLPVPAPDADGVTVSTIEAARGREWRVVVVAGCVEGELPRVRDGLRFFDREVLAGTELPTVAERRRRSLVDERGLFASACSRATSVVLATAAPEPGVLLSRFVAALPQRPPRLPLSPAGVPPGPAPTVGVTPVCPDGSLPLSASALDTYEDCPLRYAYTYTLGIRADSGLHAELGILVHQVLARFLDPDEPGEPSLERLLALADEAWRDDIARYRPQQEEARRDCYEMLTQWWEGEGHEAGRGLEVLATERRFEVPVGPHRVSGRIDRIDRAAGGGIRVVDYKTGKSKPKPDDVAANLQLATYHLAATRDPEISVWGPPTQLRLLYLRSMARFDQEVTPDHAATTEARILEAADRILAEDFEPSVHADCDHCDFHRLCPLWPEGREVGAE